MTQATEPKGLTLNSKSWYARYYLHFWDEHKLPPNLCPFFWKLMIGFAFSPILAPTLPWRCEMSNRAIGSVFGWIAVALAFAYGRAWWMFPHKTLMGTLFVLAVIVVIIAAVWGWHIFNEWKDNRRSARQKNAKPQDPGLVSVAVAAAKSWYEKHCPRIEWKGQADQEQHSWTD